VILQAGMPGLKRLTLGLLLGYHYGCMGI
jgi:hypothetical protein